MSSETDPPAVDAQLMAELDVPAVLGDASLVVASTEEDTYTTRTAPEWLDTVVSTADGRNAARNEAVEDAENDWIILADDDITFPTALSALLVDSMHRRQIAGLEDAWPTRWVLTRYTIFHRSLWEEIGGFDETREHGGDTDFAIRAEKAGARILRLPRNIVPHHDTESTFTRHEHLEWLWYLFHRHPRQMLPVVWLLALEKAGVVNRTRYDYPSDWAGSVCALSEVPAESNL